MKKQGKRLCTVEVAASMHYLLRRASQRLKAAIVPVLKDFELSTLELSTLVLVQANDWCILRTLADAVGVEPPAMNRIMNSLEDKGLVSRHKSDSDARYTFFRLTTSGEKRLEGASSSVRNAENEVLQGLSDLERRQLLLNLRRIA